MGIKKRHYPPIEVIQLTAEIYMPRTALTNEKARNEELKRKKRKTHLWKFSAKELTL
jgi:hypothetical protein